MASLTLKNLPDDLLRALREAAARDRRSLTQEIIHLLEVALRSGERATASGSADKAQVAAWRKLAGKWMSDVDDAFEAERIIKRRTKGRGVDL